MSNPPKGLHILLLDDGRQALPFMRSLKRAGHHVTVACGSSFSPARCSRYADRRVWWGDYFQDAEAFARHLLAYARKHRPDVTLAVGDIGAGIIARHKEELTRWTSVTNPDLDVFDRAADKGRTMAFCMANGIPCPKTWLPEERGLEAILAEAPFPVMVKPRRGIGAVGLHRLDAPDALRRHYETLRQRYGELLVQEFIPLAEGTQFQAEAFLDGESRMKACMVIAKTRFFPVTGGTSTANLTIERPDIQASVRRLLEGIRWVGAADVDLILDPRDQTPKILEINPRVTAGIKIGFAAGIDYADLHVRLALGLPVPEVPQYKLGVYSRNLIMDLLWYVYSDRAARRRTWPPFFRFSGPDVVFQTLSADDPLPLVGFALASAVKYAKPSVWKAKLARDLEDD